MRIEIERTPKTFLENPYAIVTGGLSALVVRRERHSARRDPDVTVINPGE